MQIPVIFRLVYRCFSVGCLLKIVLIVFFVCYECLYRTSNSWIAMTCSYVLVILDNTRAKFFCLLPSPGHVFFYYLYYISIVYLLTLFERYYVLLYIIYSTCTFLMLSNLELDVIANCYQRHCSPTLIN